MVALYTDFGDRDVYVGVMRALITAQAPTAEVVDLCHGIPAGDRHAGALMLLSAVPYLPRGTIHVCVVDPGVGTERRLVAVRAGGHTFVAPDNGVIAPVVEALGGVSEARYLTNEKLQRPRKGSTFHGRDVMAPVAAHLVRGIDFAVVGETADGIQDLPGFAPAVEADRVVGRVLHVDHFGNLVTNVLPADLQGPAGSWELRVGGRVVERWGATFGDVARGELLVYTGSVGFLEVAAREASAAAALGVEPSGAVVVEARRKTP